jgi:hypothetical protein
MPEPIYPFVPKSTRLLRRGQFWAIPLAGKSFGAGCVVGLHTSNGKPSARMFIAGVIEWVGKQPPTSADLTGCRLVECAFAHLKVVTESGGSILGTAQLQLSREPTSAEALSLKTWGFGVPALLAQQLAENGA